ncbi:MAG: HK97 gp10 family phage protein [Clostridia bacterium]|nr:HK97 gp10 family phage protein [Clostridia bacterium]
MGSKIDISHLSEEIAETLNEFNDDFNEEVMELTNTVAKKTVVMLKASSPKKTGSYGKGWGVIRKFQYKRGVSRVYTVVVHNKTDPQLTHLLEKGHADIRHGGRVAPIVHIEPAEELAEIEMLAGIRKLGMK